jgi:hypothetical protein
MGGRCFFPGASTTPPLRPRVLLGAGAPVRVLAGTAGASAVRCWSSSAAPSRTRASSSFSASPSIQPAAFACTCPAIRPSCSANASTRSSSPSAVGVPVEVVGAALDSRWVALGLRLVICPPSVLNRTAAVGAVDLCAQPAWARMRVHRRLAAAASSHRRGRSGLTSQRAPPRYGRRRRFLEDGELSRARRFTTSVGVVRYSTDPAHSPMAL